MINRLKDQSIRLTCLSKCLFITISLAAIFLSTPALAGAQTVNIDRVVAELEPEIQRTLLAGNIPSASIALIAGNRVIWTNAYPYKQYIQEHIFTPLEMASTAFEPRPDMEERLSIPYTVDEKTGSQVGAVRLKASVWPAGIVYGTVLNQANWLITNLNGGVFKDQRIISEKTLEQMFTRQYDQFKGGIEGIWGNETAGFGLTRWTQVRDGDRYIAHSGSVPGYTAFLLGNRDRKLGFAILTNGNRSHQHLFKLADRAIDLLKKYSSTEKETSVTP